LAKLQFFAEGKFEKIGFRVLSKKKSTLEKLKSKEKKRKKNARLVQERVCAGDLKWQVWLPSEGRPKPFGHTGLSRPDDGGAKNWRKEGRTQEEPSELDTRWPGEERVTRHDIRVNSKLSVRRS
jgi:hypothetical protein